MIRTGYSFRIAVGHLSDVIGRLKELNWNTAPIADRCSTFGFVNWDRQCKEIGLRPIFGVELAVSTCVGEHRPAHDYWTFLALDNLNSLHELILTATKNPGKEPSLSYADAASASGVIKISGERVQLDHIEPRDDLYIGLSPALPKGLYKIAKERGYQFLATINNLYPRKEDKEFYRVMTTRYNTKTKGLTSPGHQTYPQHILSDQEWSTNIYYANETEQTLALIHRAEVLKKCQAQLKQASLLKPQKLKTLRELCIEGAARINCDLNNQVYKDRLDRELEMIKLKEFEDYFYIIADMMREARIHMVVGPARGSSCGSLVCYLLGITAIDPIPYDLLFERFIDVTRKDLPDIDLDFSDRNRYKIFEYMERKYGVGRVARLGTVGTYQPRSCLNQAGLALRVPKFKIEKVLDSIIERYSGDSRAMQQVEDTFKDTEVGRALYAEYPELQIATRLEGHPSNASQHAAGIVITERPIMEYVAIDGRTKSAMCDKYDAEALGLLKIDALGLTQLSIFERTLELIGKSKEWLEKIPINDPAAFAVLNKRQFAGIFQYMGLALQSLAKQFKTETLNDIVAVTALARPGPMATGGANKWVRRRCGMELISYDHPLLEPFLKDTFGVVVYQEDVMRIGRELGGLDWDDVTALRKAMSKSLGAEYFDRWGDKWKAGVIERGMPPEIANKFWKDLCAFGSWTFNKSHAVAYGMVSYICCYLKAHYPVQFAAATLDAESDPMKQIAILRELAEEGIDYKPVDIDHSTDRWEPVFPKDGNKPFLVGPLNNIKGIGPVRVTEITTARINGTPLRKAIRKILETAKTGIDSLHPIADRIRKIHPHPISVQTPVVSICEVIPGETFGEVVITGIAKRIAPRDQNDPQMVAKRQGFGRYGNDPANYLIRTPPDWGPPIALNLFVMDDTDEIFCKIDWQFYKKLAMNIVERGRAGTALYKVKGTCPRGFRMIKVTNIVYIGDMDEDFSGNNVTEQQSTSVTEPLAGQLQLAPAPAE